jgi:hypothetical protein
MKNRISILLPALMILMGILSILRFSRIITVTFSENGGVDFHDFWYNGHFILQGTDPYRASLDGREPALPKYYLDKKVTSISSVSKDLEMTPDYPALWFLLLSPLAYFSWETAKTIWMLVNLALIVITPLLVLQLLPQKSTLSKKYQAIIFMAFWGLLATSNSGGNGQSSLLIFVMSLLAALTTRKYWLFSGFALGVALSKPQLSFPFFIFLLFLKKEYRVIATAVLFQIVGFIFLSLLSKTPFHLLIYENYRVVISNFTSTGISLGSTLASHSLFIGFTIFVLTASIIYSYWYMVRPMYAGLPQIKSGSWVSDDTGLHLQMIDLHALILLSLWNLLTVPHREYDAIISILPLGLIIAGFTSNYWNLTRKQRTFLIICTILAGSLLSRPADFISRIIPTQLSFMQPFFTGSGTTTLALLVIFSICVWLSFKIRFAQNMKTLSL